MTAVIKVLSIDTVIFYSMPSCRLYHSDRSSLFIRHQLRCDLGFCITAAPQRIQFTVKFVCRSCAFFIRKRGYISIDLHIWTAAVFRNLIQRNRFCLPSCLRLRLFQSSCHCIGSGFRNIFPEDLRIFFYICKKYLSEDPALIFYLFQAPRRHPAITYCKDDTQDNGCEYFSPGLFFSFIFSLVCRITLLFHGLPLLFFVWQILYVMQRLL